MFEVFFQESEFETVVQQNTGQFVSASVYITGELWGVCCEDFQENWALIQYKDVILPV